MRVDAQPGAKTLAASTRIFALCDWHCKDNQICIMKVIEILNFNRELLKKLRDAGIRLEDCRYIILLLVNYQNFTICNVYLIRLLILIETIAKKPFQRTFILILCFPHFTIIES